MMCTGSLTCEGQSWKRTWIFVTLAQVKVKHYSLLLLRRIAN
jgi:hypothetical protein